MFSEFFKLKMNPFGETPDTRFFFKSRSHVNALDEILSSIRSGRGFTLLTGEVGVGKTVLSRLLLNFLQRKTPTALVLNPALGQQELMTAIREELRIPPPAQATLKAEYDAITRFLIETARASKRTVLIIDEAQRLSFEGLETVRLLSNLETEERKLLQIVMIGQPELNERLASYELRQLSQRISVRTEIVGLSASETESYIRHRVETAGGLNFLRFDDDACALIARSSKGVPRVINSQCERIIAAAEKRQIRLIDAEFVQSLSPSKSLGGWRDLLGFGRGAET